jgi:hypothetical protein
MREVRTMFMARMEVVANYMLAGGRMKVME